MRSHRTTCDRKAPGAADRKVEWLVGLGLVLGALCATTAMGELAFRVFDLGVGIDAVYRVNYRLAADPALRYELVPRSPDGAGRINSDGMRDRERSPAKPSGTVRVACIGDSITYGFGVARDQTYAVFLEQLLNESSGAAGPRYEVLNFGVTGYNLSQSLENLKTRVLKYRPDLVIYQYCVNDLEDYSAEFDNLEARLTVAQRTYRERMLVPGRGLLGRFRLFTSLAFLIQSHTRSGQSRPSAANDPQWESIRQGTYDAYYARLHRDPNSWRRFEAGLDELAALARDKNFRPMMVIFPVFLDLDKYRLGAVHARVAAAARARGMTVLDLLPLYAGATRAGTGNFIFNALHPNPRGHFMAAQEIAGTIQPGLFMNMGHEPPTARFRGDARGAAGGGMP